MTKRAKPAEAPLPSRDEIIAFVAREREAAGERAPTKIGKREIARAFQIKGADKIGLKRVLKEMEAERRHRAAPQESHQTRRAPGHAHRRDLYA